MCIRDSHQGEPAVKQGQPLLLAQMLRNLLDNAIKYCPQGTQVRVILQPCKIPVSYTHLDVYKRQL